ncbi:MAG TPA: alpha/beta fold hydrolase [Chloroflexota bacterium]|nr:alpha/beta fold hydrolase [Chloroflexota bacterium]
MAVLTYCRLRIWRLETLDAVRDAPDGSFVDVDGLRIHYQAFGSGPPLVFIHGFAGSTYSWRLNTEPLGRSFRTYSLDLPGFGYSERTARPLYDSASQARVVKGFLEAVGERYPAAMVGSSLGCGVAVRFALDNPHEASALILVAPALDIQIPWTRLRQLFAVPVLGRQLAAVIYYLALANPRSLDRFLAAAYGDKADGVTAQMREAMLRPVRVRGTALSALGLARSMEAGHLEDALAKLRVPVMFVAGAEDRAVSLASVRRLHRRIPQSRLLIFDTGHLVQEEAATEFNEAVAEFLNEASGAVK